MHSKIIQRIITVIVMCALLISPLVSPAAAVADAANQALKWADFSAPAKNTAWPASNTQAAHPSKKAPHNYYPQAAAPKGKLVKTEDYSHTYQTSANHYTTQISGTRQAYTDSSGETVAIDNTLQKHNPLLGSDYYQPTANDITAQFPVAMTSGNGVSISSGKSSLEMIPTSGDFSQSTAQDNAIIYSNVQDGVDFQYTVIGDSVKEDIILNKYIANLSFSFQINTKNLTLKQEKDAIVAYAIGAKKDASPIFVLSAPSMQDASGLVSSAINFTLDEKDGKQIATITPDEAWLSDLNRAYPVRVDPTVTMGAGHIWLQGVEQGSGDTIIGDNGYPYVGYDDGITSGNLAGFGSMHMKCRTYVNLNYDFSQIPKAAAIDSATFSVAPATSWSNGSLDVGLYRCDQSWNQNTITWNNQTSYSQTYIADKYVPTSADTYMGFDVRSTVNNWVQGLYPNYGLCLKAIDENVQCEVLHNKASAQPPLLTINWSVPDPVPDTYGINDTTINVRPLSEKAISGKLLVDGTFADGVAMPASVIDWRLLPSVASGQTVSLYSYSYPDSTLFNSTYPQSTKYKDKLSNYQTGFQLASGLSFDTTYQYGATPTNTTTTEDLSTGNDVTTTQTGKEVLSDKFLLYKVKQNDTLPAIAKYYGVTTNTIMGDNQVQDELALTDNTLFIRNPKTTIPYSPPPLSNSTKRQIDSALMGRGLHCDYGFEPVNFNTGNFSYNATDTSVPDLAGDFGVSRTYNSLADATTGSFGRMWTFAYDTHLSGEDDGTINYVAPDGKVLQFSPDGSGGYTSPAGYNYTLTKIAYTSGTDTLYRWQLADSDGSYESFNAWGLLSGITDARGNTTTLTYDANYNLESATSPLGVTYSFTEDDSGRITAVKCPDGSTISYTYNDAGDLVSETDAEGGVTTYTYDSNHLLIEVTDPNKNVVVKNTYDDTGRVITQYDGNNNKVSISYGTGTTTATDARGNKTVYTLDSQERTTKITYPDGRVINRTYNAKNQLVTDDGTTYGYDASGNITSITRSDGAKQTATYNANAQKLTSTDYDGNKTSYTYNAVGDLTKITRADGKTQTFVYDSYGRRLSATDVGGDETAYTYTGAQIATVTDPLGHTTSYGYDVMGRRLSIKDPLGHITRITYNKIGAITSEQDATSNTTTYALDKIGNPLTITDPAGHASTAVFDSDYNLTKVTDAAAHNLISVYDACGNLTKQTNAAGQVTSYTYDSMNRKISETDPDGNKTTYTYDAHGNLASTTDARGAKTTTVYNLATDLPTKVTDPLGHVTTYTYDKDGNLISQQNPDGTSIETTYNAVGLATAYKNATGISYTLAYGGADRLTQSIANGVRTTTYTYDKAGQLTATKDALGNTTTYAYDSAGRLTSSTDAAGHTSKYTYDNANRLLSVTDGTGAVTKVTYDNIGNLATATDADGNTTTYAYDKIGDITAAKDALGNITSYSYDAVQRLTKLTNALGYTNAYTYDKNGNVLSSTDGNGALSKFVYDGSGNITKVTLPNNTAESFTYDLASNLTSSTDVGGNKTTYTYDSMGRQKSSVSSLGDSVETTYDAYGNPISTLNQAGQTTTAAYDTFGELAAVKDVNNQKLTYSYDNLGQTTAIGYSNGATETATYDPVGNIIASTTKRGAQYAYAYDAAGHLTLQTDPLGSKTSYAYDPAGNLTSTTDGRGNTTSYAYDADNLAKSMTDGRGNTTTYSYDALSQLISAQQPEGDSTNYQYDGVGNLTKTKDGAGDVTLYAYDNMGDLSKETSPTGSVTTFDYDVYGQLSKTTDPAGNVSSYVTDPLGLVTKYTKPNGSSYTYAYDEAHRLTSITSPLGLKRELSYDANGNLSKESDQLGRTTTYAYDVMGDLTSATNAKGATTSFAYDAGGNLTSSLNTYGGKTSYTYDAIDQLTSSKDPLGKVTSQTYDPTGNITSVTKPGGRTTTYTYDANDNLTSSTTPMGHSTTIAYDKDNRIISVTDPLKETTSYAYDGASRVNKVTDAKSVSNTFGYDRSGNLTSVTNPLGNATTYTYDNAGRLTAVTDALNQTTNYSYDADSNLTSIKDASGNTTSYSYDAEDNLTSMTDPQSSTKSFTYDIASRITSAKTPDGAKTTYDYDKLNELVGKDYSSDSSQNSTFGYDSAGNRIQMTDGSGKSKYTYDKMGRVTSVTNGDKKTVKYAYSDADQVSSITYPDGTKADYGYDNDGNLVTVTTKDGTTTYGYDAAGRLTSVTRPNGTVTYFTYDVNSNIVALVNDDKRKKLLSGFAYTYDERNYIATEVATASNGDKTERDFTYDSVGQLSEMTESAPDHNYDYTYQYDARGNKIKEIRAGTGGKSISTYTYDSANKLLEEDNNQTGITTYSYDAGGNLIAKKGATSDFTYEYSVESRLKAVRTQGALLMAVSYDGDGNRTFEVDRKVVPCGITQSSLSQQNASTSTDGDSTDNTNSVDSGNHLTSTETSRAAGDSETTSTATPVTKNFTTKQYVDPSKTIFWYGFGQGILQLGSSLNQALTVDLSNWFSDAWNSITGQYKLITRSDNSKAYSSKDIAALKAAGLTDDEVYDVTHPVVIPSGDDSQQSGGTNTGTSADAASGQSNGVNNLPITIPSFPGEDNRIDYDLTYYVNDTNTTNTQVLAAYGATNTLTADYSYGADGRISTQTPGKSSDYYLPDGRGSVSDLTDSAGKVLTHYTYDPSGQVTSGALPQTTDLGYNGEEYDSTTGLQYLRARYYDPQMAHFGVQDTVSGNIKNPASLNLYNYAQSNPINYSDPSGHNVAETRGDDVAPDPWVPTPVEVMENTIRNGTTAFGGTAQNRRDAGLDITGDEIIQYLYGNTTAFGGYAQNRRDTMVANTITAIRHVHSGNATKNDLQVLATAISEHARTVACNPSASKAEGAASSQKTKIDWSKVITGILSLAAGIGSMVAGVILMIGGVIFGIPTAGLGLGGSLIGVALFSLGAGGAGFGLADLLDGLGLADGSDMGPVDDIINWIETHEQAAFDWIRSLG